MGSAEKQGAQKTHPHYLHTVSVSALYDTAYKPKPPIIENLLYNGAYLFVGSPKLGKSFLMKQIGFHVASGMDLWEYKVRGGTVLYLALEDDYPRLQRQISRMC